MCQRGRVLSVGEKQTLIGVQHILYFCPGVETGESRLVVPENGDVSWFGWL